MTPGRLGRNEESESFIFFAERKKSNLFEHFFFFFLSAFLSTRLLTFNFCLDYLIIGARQRGGQWSLLNQTIEGGRHSDELSQWE